ncbi:MAG: arginase [bacterium]
MPIRLLGVPMDLGAARRGTDMGPSAIRAARLEARLEELGHEVKDAGNVFAPEPETRKVKETGLRFASEIIQACETLARRVRAAREKDEFPLVLGGDHSIAMGTVGGIAAPGTRVGVLWIDAHADFNRPETSPSGNVHGMPLAALVGRGDPRLTGIAGVTPKVQEDKIALVGARSIDDVERKELQDSDVTVFTMRDIDELGMRRVMEQAIDIVTHGTDWVHGSVDMDVVDPAYAPGVGTPVPGGITFREAHLALEMVADSKAMRSLEIVEVNPILDQRNQTAELAVGLALSAFGKRIL